MSNTTLILGESGTGKSTSLRHLDSESTFIINVLDKPLPFRGYKKKYNVEAMNYHSTDDYSQIISYINAVNERRPEITTLIIDDLQYVMSFEYMRRATEKGFAKFTELAQHVWEIINALTRTRDTLDCFVLTHSDTDQDGQVRCKTIGKMLNEKITLEGLFSCVLHSQIVDGNFYFLTQHDGKHLAKSPMGLFESTLIDNDLKYVKEAMHHYFNEDIPQ